MANLHVVYIGQRPDGLCKIGRSKQANSRRRALVKAIDGFRMLHTIRTTNSPWLERQLHANYVAKRRGGTMSEWFALDDEDISQLRKVRRCDCPDDLPDWCPPRATCVRPAVVTFSVDQASYDRLRRDAKSEGMTISEKLRRLVDEYAASMSAGR